jgi:hypothetical protein
MDFEVVGDISGIETIARIGYSGTWALAKTLWTGAVARNEDQDVHLGHYIDSKTSKAVIYLFRQCGRRFPSSG